MSTTDRKEYLRQYYHNRYVNEPEFQQKMKQKAKEWYEKNKTDILAKRKEKHTYNYPPKQENDKLDDLYDIAKLNMKAENEKTRDE